MFTVDLRRLCTISQGTAHRHMPEWANLSASIVKGVKRDAGDLAGPGIYACFWDGRLIYIGSYCGTSSDPLGGHVIDRAFKHIVGFTLRADRLFFRKAPLQNIIDRLDHEIARDLAAARDRGERVHSEGGKDASLGANGAFCATERKASFAAREWRTLRNAGPDELFARLGFAYRRILPPVGLTAKDRIKTDWIEAIENTLIAAFEPTCNTKGRRAADGPPAGLEQVSARLDLAVGDVAAKFSD